MLLMNYLDRVSATKKILRSWYDIQFNIGQNREKIARISARLTRTTGNHGMTPVKGGRTTNDDLIDGIAGRDKLAAQQKELTDLQETVTAAMDHLTEEQRFLLRCMFIDNEAHDGIIKIQNELYIQKSEAYRRTNEALERLASLLYW